MHTLDDDRKFWTMLERGGSPGDGTTVFSMPDEEFGSDRPSSQVFRSESLGEGLPVSVRVVRTEEHLRKAILVRADAFSRHYPLLRGRLAEAELEDRQRETSSFSPRTN